MLRTITLVKSPWLEKSEDVLVGFVNLVKT